MLSKNTKILSLVSFFTDVSSEIISTIFPFFIIDYLGGSPFILGLILGFSEVLVALLRIFSGFFSEIYGRKKETVFLGYSLSSIFKLLLLFSNSVFTAGTAKILERIGKGIRGVPRDSIIKESEKPSNIGKAMGFRKFMDSLGATLGPFLAMLFLYFSFSYKLIFTIAFFISLISPILIFFFVKSKPSIIKKNVSIKFDKILLISLFFSLAQFNVSFFILKGKELTGSVLIASLGYLIYNVFYTTSALPVGFIADKYNNKKLFSLAFFLFSLTMLGFIFSNEYLFLILIALFGIFMSFIEVLPRVYYSKFKNYGISLGFFQGLTGLMLLPANIIAGYLWNFSIFNLPATFIFSFLISLLASILVLFV